MTLKEQVEKAEDVANKPIIDVVNYRGEHIFVTESGSAVLLERGVLPNAVFASVEDAKRNLASLARIMRRRPGYPFTE